MKVLVIGSGGREHALAWKSSQDDAVTKVFVCPGNAGTALEEKLENISLDLNNFEEIADFCKNENIALVIIGPEQPLVMGMTDFLQAKDINTFGPSEAAAQLEGSKWKSPETLLPMPESWSTAPRRPWQRNSVPPGQHPGHGRVLHAGIWS